MGVMDRLVLSDAAWERMAPLIIGRPDQKGSTGRDNRMFVEGVLWIVRTGSPWRQHPSYRHPLDQVIQRWQKRLEEDDSVRRLETKLVNVINAGSMRNTVVSEEVLEAIRDMRQGMARLGIGHRAFEAGQIPDEDGSAENR